MSAAEQEFEKFLAEIADDLFDAKHQSFLYRGLTDLSSDYRREFNHTSAFWGVVFNALRESSILALARAYDQNQKGIHLDNLISFIRNNVDLFEIDRFRERLKDNAYLDDLLQTHRIPEEEKLKKDSELVSSRDPLVNKLIQLRNKIIAHKDKAQILGTKNAITPMTWDEFNSLVNRGLEICKYYRDLYNASRYPADGLIGRNDYKTILKYQRIALMALNLVNGSSSYGRDSPEATLEQFAQEVHQEVYRKL